MPRKIDSIMSEINKKYKSQIINQGTDIIEVDKIPFSSPTANYMTYGGVPVGKVVEFFGGEGGGKTTTALDIVKNAQLKYRNLYESKINALEKEIEALEAKGTKEGDKKAKIKRAELQEIEEQGEKVVVYVDAEQTLDVLWAKLLGVDTENMILVRPEAQSAEEVLQIVIDLVDSGNVCLVVLDSLPMLVSKNIIDESLDKKSYGGISQVLSIFCSKVTPYLTKHQCTFIGINQVREDLASMYNTESTPGGRMWKHACSLRLRFKKDTFLDANNGELTSRAENPAGNRVSIEIKKAKSCPSDRRLGYYTLNYTKGIDFVADSITVAQQYNLIRKSGAWFYLLDEEGNDKESFQGLARLINYLKENPTEYNTLVDRINERMM